MRQEKHYTKADLDYYNKHGVMPDEDTKKRIPQRRERSVYEVEFANQIKLFNLPEPKEEYRFLKDRRFRFDFAWPERMTAVEIQGGIWIKGGHNTGTGVTRDAKKANLAQIHGWKLFVFTPDKIMSGEALSTIEEALRGEQ